MAATAELEMKVEEDRADCPAAAKAPEEDAPKNNSRLRRNSPRRANDLDGRTWQRNSISIWSDIRKTGEEVKLGHPATFPIALVTRLIQCFTTDDDKMVLDPFAGIGSTPIAAELMGKVGIGIELSPEYTEQAQSRHISLPLDSDDQHRPTAKTSNGITLPSSLGERRLYTGDARNLLSYVEPDSIDLVVTSPPYWDILLRKRSADQKTVRNYGAAYEDLGKISEYGWFLEALKEVFGAVYQALNAGKYCIVIVMDVRKKDRFFSLHADLAAMMQALGFIYDDLIVWDRRHEYNNMRPLGYPYRFRINKAHEFILIFQKPGATQGKPQHSNES